MAVDDELPALKLAESVLRNFEDVAIAGLFQDSEELLEQLEGKDADMVFIDMNMPGMHGLELAGRIQELKRAIEIVFVTAYDHYAVSAYETDALDYVMKPMTSERIRKTLNRFAARRETGPAEAVQARMAVHSFGRFFIEANGRKLKFRRAKTEELFAYLLHHQGEPVAKGKIMDALWGDRDTERAQAMLYTTVYQLRKELEEYGLFEVIEQSRAGGGRCRLIWTPESWDYDEFDKAYQRFHDERDFSVAKRAVAMYKEGYLAENGYLWAESRQAELALKLVEMLERLADDEVNQQRYEFAMPYLKKWADMQPYSNRVHMKIIALYGLMNNADEAVKHERKVRDLFLSELGIAADIDAHALMGNPMSVFG